MKNSMLVLFVAICVYACKNQEDKMAQHLPPATAAGKHSVQNDFMYQYSLIDALLAGVFDGDLSIAKLKEKGDFGIGTFNTLDGEMIMLDGTVYKARQNGTASIAPDTDHTPIVFSKFFKADTAFMVAGKSSFEEVQRVLHAVTKKNNMYAVKLTGNFTSIEARSEKPASKPYPELAPYLHSGAQTSFTFTNTQGTCVGFLLPAYLGRINVPGLHLHYITQDKTKGGHVFDFSSAENLEIEIDKIQGVNIELNTNADFIKANLEKNRTEELEKVE